jgi:hypothetical protein
MTDAVIVPRRRDRARALRVVLAMLNHDLDGVVHVAAEARDAADVDRFFVAAVGVFVTALAQLHRDPISYVEQWVQYELDQPDDSRQVSHLTQLPDRVEESIVPSHVERARAMRAVLAALTEDFDAVTAAAHESTTERSVDRLLLAICDCLGIFLTSHSPDAVVYTIGWLAVELERADVEDAS